MFTYHLKIEYLGTGFVGWQIQKNGLSIQEVVENAISKFLRYKIRLIGSGRTDSGVHAFEQSAHFKTKKKIKKKDTFINSINFFLSKYSVVILDIKKKSNKFHARHSAIERTYKYLIVNRRSYLVLDKNKAWHVKKKLNLENMKKGAKILKGTHNFSTFRSSSCESKSPLKTLTKAEVERKKNKIIFTFISKSFLKQQVRSMVGSLKYLGEGKWTIKDFEKAFKSRRRSMCAPTAPPYGLYLYKVKY